ncbi:aminoacylase 1-like protein 2 [Athelia psychrophila]|uniref:Peptidase M20 domain-containing protein 2 n=1 Tax=Athelia psychrophila TaxID=1759441 RepID=A0A166P0F3_9AGAM|nr:aminoacylase 1-like protein 2 [Fibularhizoctonia sp. CBS 109695]
MQTIEDSITRVDPKLRELSLAIHDHPELGFEERFAHDILTDFMEKDGFDVTRHYLGLDTAWRAEFTSGKGGRVIGVNSEMDALPGIGHGCGHNLIAIAGVGVAIGIKAALQKHHLPGKIILLGTPAEEAGGGKILLLQRGAYKDMDACVMSHPTQQVCDVAFVSTTALQHIVVEYSGRAAHAAAAPWEGQNALDAAFLAYSAISVLRQQIKPDHRIHGVVEGKNWEPNIIPDYAKMRWTIRAPTWGEVVALRTRVTACFEAAALATACKIDMTLDSAAYYDLRQNHDLAQDFANVFNCRYGLSTKSSGLIGASTDFGNVTYEIPSIHPAFAIPSPDGNNHTAAFADAARTPEAHKACIAVTKGLAITSLRLLQDNEFFAQVKGTFDRNKIKL